MNIIQYTIVLLMAFSLVFIGQVEAKHAGDKTRSRVLKEMSKKMSYKTKNSTVKKIKL